MNYEPSFLRDACALVPLFALAFVSGWMLSLRVRIFRAVRSAFNRGRAVESARVNMRMIQAKREAYNRGRAAEAEAQHAARFYSQNQ